MCNTLLNRYADVAGESAGSSPAMSTNNLKQTIMIKHKFKFSNGDKVEDLVTGFKGIVTGSAYYLTGCNQYCVAAKAKDEFSEATVTWYDEGRLNLMNEQEITPQEVKAEKNGADKLPNKTM